MATRSLSYEDGNLNTTSVVGSRSKKYVDVDLSFAPRPDKDIYKKTDAGAVKQAVKNLLLTGKNEKPFAQNFGGGFGNILFELADEDAEEELELVIENAFDIYEPRAKLQGLNVTQKPNKNEIAVQIIFRVVNTQEVVTLDTTLSRVR
jgi:phage baseplate assembly protein W